MTTVKNEKAKELLENLVLAYGKSPEKMYARIEKIIERCWSIPDANLTYRLYADFPDGKPTVEELLLSIAEDEGGDVT